MKHRQDHYQKIKDRFYFLNPTHFVATSTALPGYLSPTLFWVVLAIKCALHLLYFQDSSQQMNRYFSYRLVINTSRRG